MKEITPKPDKRIMSLQSKRMENTENGFLSPLQPLPEQ
jgi:hypothetical protein